MNDIVHLCTFAQQPDIHLACSGWTRPAWGDNDTTDTPNVYRDEKGALYTFDRALATCPACPGQEDSRDKSIVLSEGTRATVWRHLGEVGTSSLTIWCVCMGLPCNDPSPPHDPDDFRRCHALLSQLPEWRTRLNEVVAEYPIWAGLVEHWDTLTAMLVEDEPSGESLRMYEMMKSLLAAHTPMARTRAESEEHDDE